MGPRRRVIKKGTFLTYRGDKTRALYKKRKKNSQVYKKIPMRKKHPYWSFWKVVFAGWLIRYPRQCKRIVLLPLVILIVLIYNAVT